METETKNQTESVETANFGKWPLAPFGAKMVLVCVCALRDIVCVFCEHTLCNCL